MTWRLGRIDVVTGPTLFFPRVTRNRITPVSIGKQGESTTNAAANGRGMLNWTPWTCTHGECLISVQQGGARLTNGAAQKGGSGNAIAVSPFESNF
jgi:hypothetical protein